MADQIELRDGRLRVLVVRLGAMGDILHALPAVTALRAAHPEWFLGWVVEPRWAELLRARDQTSTGLADCSSTPSEDVQRKAQPQDHRRANSPDATPEWMPVVDRVHLAGAKGWGRRPLIAATWREVRRVKQELREAEYDVCLDLQGAVRSAWIGRWAGARRMIGEDDPRERAARWLFSERVKTQGRHVIEQCLEVAGRVASETLPFTAAALPRDATAEGWCREWLAAALNPPDRRRPLVLLNPGAGWGAKRWPTDRYGKVAAALARMGCSVVVNAGPGEADLAAAVGAASGGAAVAVSPDISQLIALTRRAALVIAGDTGPLHLANALGCPVVGIFGPTDPCRNGPFGSKFRNLRHPESRRDHSRLADPEPGLLTISVDAVVEAALELMGTDAATGARP